MGDKTQLLALVLAARFKKPWAVMSGILVATLLNHGLASYAGNTLAGLVRPDILRWGLVAIFAGFALWILIPDKAEEVESNPRFGAFLTTVFVFFLAEMGDKTQLATLALGAKYSSAVLVTAGTTLGMLAADGLVVFLGPSLTQRIPMKWIRLFSSALFLIFALVIAIGI